MEALPITEYVTKVKLQLVREPAFRRPARDAIKSPKQVYDIFGFLINEPSEEFWVLLLNRKLKPTGIYMVSRGTDGLCPVRPREVFAAAIGANASTIIVVHNHPSGDLSGSEDDEEITARLRAGGELLGITVADHVVVSDEGYLSLMTGESWRC